MSWQRRERNEPVASSETRCFQRLCCSHLFAVVRDGGQDGAQRFDPHGDVQQVAGEEEVVVMSQQGHNRVPTEVQESLQRDTGRIVFKK